MAEKVLTTASGRQVKAGTPGAIGYESSALLPSGQGTVDGDAFNQFRGYVGPQGGGFGGYAGPATRSVMDDLADPHGATTAPDDPNLSAKVRRGLVQSGVLNADGSFTQRTLDLQAANGGAAGESAPPVPDSALDLYGQRDAATSNRPVLKASDTFATLRQQARRMATPQLLPQSGTVPNTGTLPANPFDQFSAAQAPAAQSPAMTPAVGTGFETTAEGGILSPRIGTSPSDVEQGVPLPGGVQTTPTGDEEAILSPRIINSPVQAMGAPEAGGMGGRSSVAGFAAGGAGLGVPSGIGTAGGLRKIGAKRNPLVPDSRQGSGLFSGLRKLGQQKRPMQSPTGGAPMAPNLSAY